MHIRILDLGSNSLKASLYSIEHGAVLLVDKEKLDYALGDAVFSVGSIPASAMERVAEFVRDACAGRSDAKPHFTFALATSAVRSAGNRETLVKRVEQKTGFAVRVLSGAEESFLIHTGIIHSHPGPREGVFKTIDIGGGSAEVSWSRGDRYLFGRSYELGAIRLASRFLKSPAFGRGELERVYDHALVELSRRTPEKAPPADRTIGSSGNMRAISRMVEAMRGPAVAGLLPEITPGVLEDLRELAVGRTPQNLSDLFDLPLKRARIVVPAVLTLLACMRHFGIPRLGISDAGLREGAAHFWIRHGHLNLPVFEEGSAK